MLEFLTKAGASSFVLCAVAAVIALSWDYVKEQSIKDDDDDFDGFCGG